MTAPDPSFVNSQEQVDRLLGEGPFRTQTVTLTGAAALTRGAVLGRRSADNVYLESILANNDGSEIASAILLKDADPSSGDVTAEVYVGGGFNENALDYGLDGPGTAATKREQLREFGIYTSPVDPGHQA